MCYPNGHRIRFSYQRKWIADLARIASAIDAQRCVRALIVFGDIPAVEGSDFDFVPLRHAVVEALGPSAIVKANQADETTQIGFQLRLGDFVNVSPKTAPGLIDGWNVGLKTRDLRPYPQKHPKASTSKFVFELGQFWEDQPENQDSAWFTLVSRLAKSQTLRESHFLRLRAVRALKPGGVGENVSPKDDPQFPAFTLVSGRSYTVHLQTFFNARASRVPQELTSKASTERIRLNSPLIDAIANYSETRLLVSVSDVLAKSVATLTIEDSADTDQQVARIQLLLQLQPAAHALVLLVFLLVAGTLLSGVNKEVVEDFARWTSVAIGNPSTWVYASKVLGGILVGLGGYLGFRRFPKMLSDD